MVQAPSTKMTYARLGNSGLKVSRIILGCATYGDSWYSWTLPEEEGITHIKAAYDAGINTFDTANIYSYGQSETILGKALKQHNIPRESVVIMTKVYFFVEPPKEGRGPVTPLERINNSGLSRKHIFASIKASLARLQLDYVDVLFCHRFDDETPISETMQALHDVVQAGYARYIGMSSCRAWQFHAMQNYAINNKLTPFIAMQNHHSLIYREEEREMFPTLKHFGITAVPWSPLGRGLLARPLTQQTKRSSSDRLTGTLLQDQATREIINRVEELAKKKGVNMAQVAIAWSLSKEGISGPIIGASSLDKLYDSIGGLDVTLTEEEIKYLEEPYKPQNIKD